MVVPSARLRDCLSLLITVHPHEISTLLHASASFFFLLGSYFMVIPFRDEAAISLGKNALPLLFVASLLLTLIAAPISSHLLSLPSMPKSKAILIMYRFFAGSLILFFALYAIESFFTSSISVQNFEVGEQRSANHRTFTILRVCFYIWIALMNLFTTSALWARLADIMNSEAGSRLFGFVGAGATLGQLTGSILAVVLAPSGSFLLLLSALFMEFGARCALGIGEDESAPSNAHMSDSTDIWREDVKDATRDEHTGQPGYSIQESVYSRVSSMLEGLYMVLASSYLLHICCFLWLTAVVSSFFYFQRTNVVAGYAHDPLERRMILAEINSFTAIFILIGQLTVTGRLLSYFGVTIAICASPFIAFVNMGAISISPVPMVIAISEASRKVTTYVLTKPGREVLFTVISHEEKYKAKVFIDTFVQRLGDAAAAGLYEAIGIVLPIEPSTVAICALPLCLAWFLAALTLGRRQRMLADSLLTVQGDQ